MKFDVLKFIADHAGMSMADALTDAYNIGKLAGASESDENDKWTPCTPETMPPDGLGVLVSVDYHLPNGRISKEVLKAYYDSEDDAWLTCAEFPYVLSYVMAWRNLPEPYEA